jgi:hypothetical protein
MSTTRTLGSAAIIAATALLLFRAPLAHAGRCNTGLISGGHYCGECLDPTTLPNPCDPGEELVIYDLDKPFGFDGAGTSSVTIRSAVGSPCGTGFEQQEPVDGYVLACWSPPDRQGCREMHIPNNGYMCLRIKDDPLACPGECAAVRTGQIAISTAGAADRYICPPTDPDTCRSTRAAGEERFRLWIGGLCSTNGCDINDPSTPSDDTPGADTCTSEWGATLFGYSRGRNGVVSPPGFYHWKTASFDLEVTDGKSTCGKLGKCLGRPGNRNPWTLRVVGTPRPGFKVPCLGEDACSPLAAGDAGCL